MCGIAGLIGWEGRDDQVEKLINNMQSSLYHRGPDAKGFWHSHKHKIIFIHTRLSIIDLSKSGINLCIHLVKGISFHSMVKYIIT